MAHPRFRLDRSLAASHRGSNSWRSRAGYSGAESTSVRGDQTSANLHRRRVLLRLLRRVRVGAAYGERVGGAERAGDRAESRVFVDALRETHAEKHAELAQIVVQPKHGRFEPRVD